MARFLEGTVLSANQIEFINLVVNHLTEHGVIEPGALYESPFTDLAPEGPDGLFPNARVTELFAVLDGLRDSASAA